jgi:rSAM/selenodomain-associated transferase 1
MAKVPVPGRVKTRLGPLLGPDGCARLQRALITRTCTVVVDSGLPLFVFLDDPVWAEEAGGVLPPLARVRRQATGDLGRRMLAAVRQVHREQPGPVLVIGTDAPTLAGDLLTAAATTLREGADAVLGPALDGGYYLAGLARPIPAVFGIDPLLWGGDGVLAATQQQLYDVRVRWQLLPTLRDLDTPEDAAALLADPALPAVIAAHLVPSAVQS